MQIAPAHDAYGANAGWSYLSRFLNNIPPDRLTVDCLGFFLKVESAHPSTMLLNDECRTDRRLQLA